MFKNLGHSVIRFYITLGGIALLTLNIIRVIFTRPKTILRSVFDMYQLGVQSLPITLLTSVFVGMAFSVQVVREFLRFGASEMVGGVIGMALWRELAPMMTGVAIAGRVGAAIASELGTMKVTEQVEAMESMGQDKVAFLAAPRVLAITVMMPLLVGMADIFGMLSGYLVAILSKQINTYSFINAADRMLVPFDIYSGLIKAVIFGFSTGIISCYMGLSAEGGAKGVGEVTTKAVVVSLVVVFMLNYLLSMAMFT